MPEEHTIPGPFCCGGILNRRSKNKKEFVAFKADKAVLDVWRRLFPRRGQLSRELRVAMREHIARTIQSRRDDEY